MSIILLQQTRHHNMGLVILFLLLAACDPSSSDTANSTSTKPIKPTSTGAQQYTLRFETNGGSAVAEQSLSSGTKASKPASQQTLQRRSFAWVAGTQTINSLLPLTLIR